jgi:HSP20 family molecular chaperone IbpA
MDLIRNMSIPIETILGRLIDRVSTDIPLFNNYVPQLNNYMTKTNDGYLFEYPVPGLSKDEVNVKVKGHNMYITGTRSNNKSILTKVYKYECILPEDAELSSLSAKVMNGVLYITLSKKRSEDSESTINIEIN